MVRTPAIAQDTGVVRRLAGLGGTLVERLFPKPIVAVDDLGRFVGQRSAYIAQAALYGYLKTRMGTSFPRYFEDATFAASIKLAAVRQFVACAADLAIHAAGLVAADGRLGPADAAGLARRCFAVALATGLPADDAALAPADAAAQFATRAEGTAWAGAAGDAAFTGSIAELIRNAPVIDEYKALDRTIVTNSMRFRWREIRDQLVRRLDAAAVAGDWLEAGPRRRA